jgi:DNA modification methylase
MANKKEILISKSKTDLHTAPVSSLGTIGLKERGGHTKNGIGWRILCGDAQEIITTLPENKFHCVVTSPPYFWQRDYNVLGQIGKESTIAEYVKSITHVMDGVKRTLRNDGLLFLNLGDTYYSAKGEPKGDDKKNNARRFGLRAVDSSGLGVQRKTLIGIPWRVAIEMIDRGWTLRAPIIWQRDSTLPEPTAKDRPWRTYEMVFMFSKSPKYHFYRTGLEDEEDIWKISSRPKSTNGLHSATFPEELVQKCLKVGCPKDGEVLDPFVGSGTVMRVALRSNRPSVGIDISQVYCNYIANELDSL